VTKGDLEFDQITAKGYFFILGKSLVFCAGWNVEFMRRREVETGNVICYDKDRDPPFVAFLYQHLLEYLSKQELCVSNFSRTRCKNRTEQKAMSPWLRVRFNFSRLLSTLFGKSWKLNSKLRLSLIVFHGNKIKNKYFCHWSSLIVTDRDFPSHNPNWNPK